MTISGTASPVKVEIIPALKGQEPILANLLELYAHDFSEFMELELGADGRFGYKHLPLYWEESNRFPFLILVNGRLAGFVFVRGGSAISGDADVWDMAEFFVVRRYRRLGIGAEVAREIWERFPGKWEVRVMDRNQNALRFWPRAIGEYLGREVYSSVVGKAGEGWHVFSFESNRRASDAMNDPIILLLPCS